MSESKMKIIKKMREAARSLSQFSELSCCCLRCGMSRPVWQSVTWKIKGPMHIILTLSQRSHVMALATAQVRIPPPVEGRHRQIKNKQICFGTSLGWHTFCITLPLFLVTWYEYTLLAAAVVMVSRDSRSHSVWQTIPDSSSGELNKKGKHGNQYMITFT